MLVHLRSLRIGGSLPSCIVRLNTVMPMNRLHNLTLPCRFSRLGMEHQFREYLQIDVDGQGGD